MKIPLNELGLNDAARGIRNGSFSSEELVLAYLERIRQRENHVGAWIHLDEDQALEQARECDRTKPEDPRSVSAHARQHFSCAQSVPPTAQSQERRSRYLTN